jgi:tRNA(Ile)-lysidine synthase
MMDGTRRFDSDTALQWIGQLPAARRYWVGFSGGADSTALLLALHSARQELRAPLAAVHFDHGLQASARQWEIHCRDFCSVRGIPYRAVSLSVRRGRRESPEEAARNARYRAVAGLLDRDEMFLTAHHAEDQAETLLLNLMRGSGPDGLAGIPRLRTLGKGWVARPLLDVSRELLRQYLAENDIPWQEDPSNEDTSYDRNYLRQELFPLLEARWPGVAGRMARTARLTRQSTNALSALIEERSGAALGDRVCLSLDFLRSFDPELRALVMRQWLRRHEVPTLPEVRLLRFLEQLEDAKSGNEAETGWSGWQLKRYRDSLWLHRREPAYECAEAPWSSGMTLQLGNDSGRYRLLGPEIPIPRGWRVGRRAAGSRLRAFSDGPSRRIKHILREAGIPPWLRLGIPVLYWDDEPVAVGDWALGHRLKEWLATNGLKLEWRPADPVLARARPNTPEQRKT